MLDRIAELYRALFRIALLGQIQYRASGMIWMIGSVVEPTVYLVVWSAVSTSRGGDVAGYGPHEFAAYYMTMLVVSHLTFSWVMHDFTFRVQYGSLSFELLRPIHPIHADVCANLAYKALMLVVVVPALAVLWFTFEPNFTPNATSLNFLPVLVLAFAVRFCIEWTLALAAFWTTRVTALNQVYFSVQMFLSGRVAPIAVMPLWLQDTAHTLPFYYTVAFPVEVALGRLTPTEILQGLAAQLMWLAVALGLLALIWRRAVRHFSAVGQ
ncbi:MAG: ABC-2 family transporter protein [Gammaproteobacteria bacterium]|jgi:ABC-2 type transport system permease protein